MIGSYTRGTSVNKGTKLIWISLGHSLESSTKRNAVEFVAKDFEWSLIDQAFARPIIQPILDHRKLFV